MSNTSDGVNKNGEIERYLYCGDARAEIRKRN